MTQLIVQVTVQGIELCGTIEPDDGDTALVGEDNLFA